MESGPGGRPALGSNFLVDFGNGKSRQSSGGFAEVIFPEFRLGTPEDSTPVTRGNVLSKSAEAGSTLILKRGVTGALDLYAWWDLARKGKAPTRKSLKIQLLSPDHQRVVLTWTFHKVRPVTLAYTPLRAQESEVVMETIEFAFASFELS